MKLVRFGPPGEERPGVWLDSNPDGAGPAILDVRAMAFDIEDYNEHFFTHWGLERLRNLLAEPNRKWAPAEGTRLGPPVAPAQILCLGKNYRDHAIEFDADIPAIPIYFSKSPSALNGPFDPVVLPKGSSRVDGEVELAVVLGSTFKRVPEAGAMSCIAGYTILNDITDRDAQRDSLQWFRGKSFDTFCPLGPYLVTPDEIPDPGRLNLFSKVNGLMLQQSNTRNMIFSIPFILSHLSRSMTLKAGDIVSTGTPAGIGSAHKPPILLKDGDFMETEIEKLGGQAAPVRREAP